MFIIKLFFYKVELEMSLNTSVNEMWDADTLAEKMGISEGPYCMFKNITAGTSILLLERLLDGVIFRTSNSRSLATYAYRFLAGENGEMLMVIFASQEIIRTYGNSPTPDPIGIGNRVVIFEKKFKGNQIITAQICDRDQYRSLVQSLVN